eukprot:scaffold1242_cov123-Isochrysis_galbana.AAC.4
MCHLVCAVCGWDACTDCLRAVDATEGAAHTHDARRRSALGAGTVESERAARERAGAEAAEAEKHKVGQEEDAWVSAVSPRHALISYFYCPHVPCCFAASAAARAVGLAARGVISVHGALALASWRMCVCSSALVRAVHACTQRAARSTHILTCYCTTAATTSSTIRTYYNATVLYTLRRDYDVRRTTASVQRIPTTTTTACGASRIAALLLQHIITCYATHTYDGMTCAHAFAWLLVSGAREHPQAPLDVAERETPERGGFREGCAVRAAAVLAHTVWLGVGMLRGLLERAKLLFAIVDLMSVNGAAFRQLRVACETHTGVPSGKR